MTDRVDELVAILTARLCLSPECSGDISCEDCQETAREALVELAAIAREADAANVRADEAGVMCEWLAKLAGDAMCQSLRCDDCPCFGKCRAKNETVCIAALLAAAREAGQHGCL